MTDVEMKIVALAIENKNVGVGFGGFGTNIGTLARYCGVSIAPLFECLKRLHAEGRIYLQYWNWPEHGFQPWTPFLTDSFFNDFRLLDRKPESGS